MKRNILFTTLLTITTLFTTGCVTHDDVYQASDNEGEDLMPRPMQELKVDVPSGKCAVVMFGGDTLAVCPESTTIMAPNTTVTTVSGSSAVAKAATRADNVGDITIEYLDKLDANNVLLAKQRVFEIMAFEDSKDGDYDYNDLIVHVKIEKDGNNYYLSFHPVALGAIKTIGLGCVLRTANGSEWNHLIFDDVRTQLFKGQQGFINTEAGKELTKFSEIYKVNVTGLTGGAAIKSVDWFIEVGGERIYAVSNNYKFSDANNKPYGLIMAKVNSKGFWTPYSDDCGYDWFDYPAEKVNIDEVYNYSNTFFTKNSYTAGETAALYLNLGFKNSKNASKVINTIGTYTENNNKYVISQENLGKALYAIKFENNNINVTNIAK